MKEIPMLFNTDMVKAILEGRKTQTRKIVKPQPPKGYILAGMITSTTGSNKDIGKLAFTDLDYRDSHLYKPPCQVGDVIWVRETWQEIYESEESNKIDFYIYKTDYPNLKVQDESGETTQAKWHKSIHMPRSAARIFKYEPYTSIEAFKMLWNEIYKNWSENPWVWVIEFERTNDYE